MASVSFRWYSLLNAGSPAVRIQTWNASQSFKFGGGCYSV